MHFNDPEIKGMIKDFFKLLFLLLLPIPIVFLFSMLGMPVPRWRWTHCFFWVAFYVFCEVVFFVFILKARRDFFKKYGKYP